ncbi:uncharacterized protein M6B38_252440 [Iris pallida]|uniref:Uncharacterized protein n=1 Tax=Iris pallida TaxID=29817 RepID=A0AAX6IJJ0_IRIPA|nr:uncharacterized protein M6B38_252440 [Iris pallida]
MAGGSTRVVDGVTRGSHLPEAVGSVQHMAGHGGLLPAAHRRRCRGPVSEALPQRSGVLDPEDQERCRREGRSRRGEGRGEEEEEKGEVLEIESGEVEEKEEEVQEKWRK